MVQVDTLANEIGLLLYGMTSDQAIKKNVCIKCKKPPRFKSDAGRAEYKISGMCEFCFDEEFGDL